jgi:RND family efflux transporter MFP subunit
VKRRLLQRQCLARFAFVAALVCLVLSGMTGCSPPDAQASAPPPGVTVNRPVRQQVIEWDQYSGHLESPQSVNLQAQVSGELMDTPFDEGSIVQKGGVLFVIDDRPFKAALEARQADVSKAEAQEALATVQYKRSEGLHKIKSVSDQDYDNAVANLKQAQAVRLGAEAAVKTAALNVEWTRVVAPITGRVGRKNITVGNQVNGVAGQATILTTIQSIDPMYCYVDVNEQAVLKYQRLAKEKKRVSARDARIPTYLGLANEEAFPHPGVVDFVDNKVSTTTGTLVGRGVFPNPDASLTPGFFGRVLIPGSGIYETLLVPDAAIGTDQDSKFLLVVKPDDTVEVRPVKLGALFGKLRAIEDGVTEKDRVIVKGMQLARPGLKVAAAEKPIPADAFRLVLPMPPTTQASPAAGNVPARGPAGAVPSASITGVAR